jgi:hypothetical protein
MMAKTTKLVQSAKDAIHNIEVFLSELKQSKELQSRVAYSRAWYAIKKGGGWHFGPSKFIGYEGMTAGEYVGPNEDRDGRKTEVQLQDWFELPSDPALKQELQEALADFLARYGKTPSRKTRINVLRRASNVTGESEQQRLIDLIVAVSKMLSPDQRQELRARL